MFQEFVHYSCVVFCMWFNIHTVVGKGLNLWYMFDHTCSGLKKSKFLWVFACCLLYLQWLEKGLNLCIFDMFDHTCSGLKKSKLLCTNVPRICSFLVCSFSYVVYHTYSVGKGLNLCILDMFDHTCSGLKSLNFYVQMFEEFVPY